MAQKYADGLGGSLAVVNDEQEYNDIRDYLVANGQNSTVFDDIDCGLQPCDKYFEYLNRAHIGLSDIDDDNVYQWVDGSELNYSPDLFNKGDKFVNMESTGWRTSPFFSTYSILLELPLDVDIEQLNQQRVDFIDKNGAFNNAFLNRWWDKSAHWQIFSTTPFRHENYNGEWGRSLAHNYWGTKAASR